MQVQVYFPPSQGMITSFLLSKCLLCIFLSLNPNTSFSLTSSRYLIHQYNQPWTTLEDLKIISPQVDRNRRWDNLARGGRAEELVEDEEE